MDQPPEKNSPVCSVLYKDPLGYDIGGSQYAVEECGYQVVEYLSL
jgi:hypothetical protein